VAVRKLWKVEHGDRVWRPESKVKAYNIVQAQAANHQCARFKLHIIRIYVDERDGQGWQLYEAIDLRELPAWGNQDRQE